MAEIPSEDNLKAFWNAYADEYERNIRGSTDLIYELLVPFLNVSQANCIIETGCGTGSGLEILKKYTTKACTILANDISENMVEKVNQKLLEGVSVVLANNEQLPYDDHIADAYVANLSIHIVSDPLSMAKEAVRVLKNHSVGVFTVWGKAEDSNMFVIVGKALRKAGIEPGNERSPFYLNKHENLNQILKDAGFNRAYSFYTAVTMNVSTSEEFVRIAGNMPNILPFKNIDLEKYQEILRNVGEFAQAVLESGRMITFDALVSVGYKD